MIEEAVTMSYLIDGFGASRHMYRELVVVQMLRDTDFHHGQQNEPDLCGTHCAPSHALPRVYG